MFACFKKLPHFPIFDLLRFVCIRDWWRWGALCVANIETKNRDRLNNFSLPSLVFTEQTWSVF
jgi:hypothetical protein